MIRRLPAGAPDETGRRIAHLPAAIVGNGSLLATVSARGELEKLFWPHLDWAQQLGELSVGVTHTGAVVWLDSGELDYEQRYAVDSTVLVTRATRGPLAVELTDVVDPETPVLSRRIRVAGGEADAVAVYVRPTLGGSADHGGAYVDPRTGAVVFYRREHVLAVVLGPAGSARVGRIEPGAESPTFADLDDAALDPAPIAYGTVDGAAIAPFAGEALLVCAFADDAEDAIRLAEATLDAGFDAALGRRRRHDRLRLDDALPPATGDDAVARAYRRSLLTFDLLSDARTGGVIAAPELDEQFRRSGGYGFVWGRDMAFSILGFLAAGRRDLAERALRWLVGAQSRDGLWLHRHWTTGGLAPSWGLHQIDETGAILFAYETAWHELQDERLDRELWHSARHAAEFLLGFRSPATGLPLPSVDLWEERDGVHTYSAAAIAGGLRAAASMARRHEPRLTSRYDDAADGLCAAIESQLWDEEQQSYVRSASTPQSAVDLVPDVSLLGLGWPFAVVYPGNERMIATARRLEQRLALPGGGMLRYEGDDYAGGNSWVIAVLWLGLWHRAVGDEARCRECLDYAVRASTPLGLIPEQVATDGRPAWVVPLTWSHAMLVIATQPELAYVSAARHGAAAARSSDPVTF